MKILITGSTARQTKITTRPISYTNDVHLLKVALEELGHEVDWRIVTPGENLDGYDRVIVYLANVMAFGARYLFGALWALAVRNDAFVSFDDPRRLHTTAPLASGPGKGKGEKFYLWDISASKQRSHYKEARRVRKEIEAMAFQIRHGNLQRTALIRRFEFPGVAPTATPFARRIYYDPTPLMPVSWVERVTPLKARKKAIVVSGLYDHREMAKGLQPWAIERYGHPKTGAPRIDETELADRYAATWGIAVTPYDNDGTGAWRPRYVYAVATRSFLYGPESKDLALALPSHQFDIQELYGASPARLARVADFQAEELTRHFAKKSVTLRRLDEALKFINTGIEEEPTAAVRNTPKKEKPVARKKPTTDRPYTERVRSVFAENFARRFIKPSSTVLEFALDPGASWIARACAENPKTTPHSYFLAQKRVRGPIDILDEGWTWFDGGKLAAVDGKTFTVVVAPIGTRDPHKYLADGGTLLLVGDPLNEDTDRLEANGLRVADSFGLAADVTSLREELPGAINRFLRQTLKYLDPDLAGPLFAAACPEATQMAVSVVKKIEEETEEPIKHTTHPPRDKKPSQRKTKAQREVKPSAKTGKVSRRKAKAAVKDRPKPAGRRPTVDTKYGPVKTSGELIRAMLRKGKSDEEILAYNLEIFPWSKAGKSDVNWNRRKLEK